MSGTSAISIRGVDTDTREAYSRLRGTYMLDGAQVLRLSLQLLELELNIVIGARVDRVQAVKDLIQHRRDQIVSRYQRANVLNAQLKDAL